MSGIFYILLLSFADAGVTSGLKTSSPETETMIINRLCWAVDAEWTKSSEWEELVDPLNGKAFIRVPNTSKSEVNVCNPLLALTCLNCNQFPDMFLSSSTFRSESQVIWMLLHAREQYKRCH